MTKLCVSFFSSDPTPRNQLTLAVNGATYPIVKSEIRPVTLDTYRHAYSYETAERVTHADSFAINNPESILVRNLNHKSCHAIRGKRGKR